MSCSPFAQLKASTKPERFLDLLALYHRAIDRVWATHLSVTDWIGWKKSGVSQVFVLGDPAYCQRFGVSPERHVLTPYPLPAEYGDAWQSMPLATRAPLLAGRLSLPEPWVDADLW